MLTRLQEHRVAKPWGQTDIPSQFGPAPADGPLGEIWFQRADDQSNDALLVKYLFTSEHLSVQVHPGDATARLAGHERGKDEAWLVLEAKPGAEIGIGFKEPVSDERLRAAALDGSIVELIDWRQVKTGDCFYSPAGTIHSIGPGLTLLEVQQNSDITYRLYDFGRPRELHLDEGVQAARVESRISPSQPLPIGPGRQVIARGPKFVVERWTAEASGCLDAVQPLWLIPLRSPVAIDGTSLDPPGVWIAETSIEPAIGPGGILLIAYEGNEIR